MPGIAFQGVLRHESQNRSVDGDHAGGGDRAPSLRPAGVDPFAGRTGAAVRFRLAAETSKMMDQTSV